MNQRLVIIIELLVAFGLYFWYIQPMYTVNIKALNTEIAAKQTAISTMKRYLLRESQLEEKQKSIPQSNISRLSKILPYTNDTAQFLLNINTLALRYGIILDRFDVQKQGSSQPQNVIGAKQKLYKTFILGISGSGTYSNFRQFIDGLERSLRLIDVTDLSITTNVPRVSSNIKTSRGISYKYSLKLKIYRLQPEL